MANTNTFFKPIKTQFDTFTIVLCNRDHTRLGAITNVDLSSVHLKGELANGNEVSFDVYYELNGEVEKLWEDLVDLKLIYIPEIDDYLEIAITDYDSVERKKSIVGVNAGIAELSQTQLYGLEINTEEDINRDKYDQLKPTIFYRRDDPKTSLLNRVLEKVPQYSIGHVPVSVAALQRTFSVNDKSVWEFLSKDVAEAFDVLFVIDNVNKKINVYDLLVVCNECHERQQPHYEYGYYEDVNYATDSDSEVVTNGMDEWLYGNDRIVAYKKLVCKSCGSEDLDYFGEDTNIIINKDNLTDEITLTIDADSIKNTFKLECGDDDMTAAVVASNPNGSAYLNRFNDLDYADMPRVLIDKLDSYSVLYDSYKDEYAELMEDYYDAIDNILKYQSSLMPKQREQTITARTEAAKLTVSNLSPVALTRVGENTSVNSVSNALVQLAKCYVKTGYVKVEVDTSEGNAPSFSYVGPYTDDSGNEYHYGYWQGRFLVTSYSDNEDTAYSARINIVVNDEYEEYLEQKISKQIVKYDDKEGSIYSVLNIKNLLDFTRAIKYYSVNRLISFRDALSNCLNIMVQEGHASPTKFNSKTGSYVVDEFYDDVYIPYRNRLDAVEAEIPRRQSGKEIDGTPCTGNDGYGEPYATANVDYWTNILGIVTSEDGTAYVLPDSLEDRKNKIQDALNLKKYLGDNVYKTYCAYRREQTYSNSNYISTGLDNAQIFEKAQEFIKAANEELLKASTPQYTVKCNLYNLLPTKGYEYYKDKMVLGNWIRVLADDQLFRLRLLSFNLDLNDPSKVDIEFSNVTKIGNIVTDLESILNSAKSMSTSYGYTAKQAEAGKNANDEIGDFVKTGLMSAVNNLKNNVDEEITFGKYGIYAKSLDPDTSSYSPEQLRITHNILAFTDDNWQTAKTALGKHEFTHYYPEEDTFKVDSRYGLTAEFVQAGYINGASIVGGDIYSENYSDVGNTGSHIDLNNGTFEFGGKKLVFDGNDLVIKDGRIEAGSIEGSTINIGNGNFVVNEDGDLTAYSAKIVNGVYTAGTITGGVINGGTIDIGNGVFTVDSNGHMACTGATINGDINNGNGTFSVTSAGYLTAKSGTIGGWNIGGTTLSVGNVTLSSSGDIYCRINNDYKWAIYNNGNATFSNITATGGTFENVTVNGYATIEELNRVNLTIQGQLKAAVANIGTLSTDKANIEDLTAGTLVVENSVNAQNATIANNLDVNGTITVNQIKDSQGNVPSGTLKWQSISVAKGLGQNDKQYLYQNTDTKQIAVATAPPASNYHKISDIVLNVPTKKVFILGVDNAS